MTALRTAAFAIGLVWWSPTILLMAAATAGQRFRFRRRMRHVRALNQAGRLVEAQAKLDQVRRDFT